MRTMFNDVLKATRQTCEQCKVSENENVVIFTDTAVNETVAEAFYVAASARASAFMITVDSFPMLTNPPEIAVKAMCDADVVFDLSTNPWLYTEATDRVLASGTRMLQVMVSRSPEAVVDRPPTTEILKREKVAHKWLDNCKSVRITSEEGTDIVLKRGDRPIHTQGGSVSTSGSWDSYGISLAAFASPEDQADGVVVVKGTVHVHPELMIVDEPFRLEVKGGKLTKIEGNTAQAEYFSSWLKEWNHPGAYVIAHTGFGLDERIRSFSAADPGGPESKKAAINIAFGSNMFRFLAGDSKAPSHTDIILFDHNFYVDDKLLIEKGKFVPDAGI